MRRPRETVDAAVLAAAIGIDRAVEADIGRVVVGDNRLRGIDADLGADRRRHIFGSAAVAPAGIGPVVGEGFSAIALEAPGRIDRGAATLPRLWGHGRDLARRQPERNRCWGTVGSLHSHGT